MKHFILLGLFSFLINSQSFAQTKNFIDQAYLETTAKVDSLVQPDEIYLSIVIREKDSKGKVSVETQEEQMVLSLEKLGINTAKQLTLADFGSNFQKYFLRKKDILKSKAYELKVFDTQTAGKAMVKLEEIGIANVHLSKTQYSKMEELKLTLKSKAILKAKQQAIALLKPLNQKIIKAIHISDHYRYNHRSSHVSAMEMDVAFTKKSSEYNPPNIQFKAIKVESEVNVKFAIE